MDILVRKANHSDFPAIFSLIKEFASYQRTPEKVKISLDQLRRDKDIFRCYVAETATNDIVGYASFFYAYYDWTGKAIYLDDLYVKESYRKHKVGARLLDSIVVLARKEKCTRVRWQVSKWNSNAIAFYKKIGAVIDDVEINCNMDLGY